MIEGVRHAGPLVDSILGGGTGDSGHEVGYKLDRVPVHRKIHSH